MLLESEAIHTNSRMDNQAMVDSGTQWLGTQVQTLRLIEKKKRKSWKEENYQWELMQDLGVIINTPSPSPEK